MSEKVHGSTALHQKLVKDFQIAVGEKYDNLIIIPYTSGMFRDFDTANRVIHAGLKGVPDLICFGPGWYMFFDAKTGGATFSKEQHAFKSRMKTINFDLDVVHKLRSVEYGISAIDKQIKIYQDYYDRLKK